MVECIESNQQQQFPPSYNLRQASVPLIDDTGGGSGFCLQTSGHQQHKLLSMYPQQQQLPQQQQQLKRQQTLVELPTNQQQQQLGQQQSGNELIGYYFGSISRETAEWILKTHGSQMDGAYLLRSSGPNDDFVLSIMVNHLQATNGSVVSQSAMVSSITNNNNSSHLEVLHYKIVETEDSFVALHGQVGDEKFATIDELIDKAQGVATKPKWPIHRQSLESQILPPTYWGLTVDQVRLAIFIKAKQWGFPLLSTLFVQGASPLLHDGQVGAGFATTAQQQIMANITGDQAGEAVNITTLNNETIRTLIYKSLHEFQPWFHGKIGREEAERRIEEGSPRDGRFLVRERDNYSYAMCISHKRTTKHYRIDVLPTGELAIQDGRKFTSLMALVSHYTIMSDGLWCALTEACARPVQSTAAANSIGSNSSNTIGGNRALGGGLIIGSGQMPALRQFAVANGNSLFNSNQNLYCVPPLNSAHMMLPSTLNNNNNNSSALETNNKGSISNNSAEKVGNQQQHGGSVCNYQGGVTAIKAPIREWLQTINQKWSQLMASKNQHQSLNSFLFGNQNPLNNHCRHNHRGHHHHHHHHHHHNHRSRKCKNGHASCGGCVQQAGSNSNSSSSRVAGSSLTLPYPANNQASSTSVNRAESMNQGQSAQQANKTNTISFSSSRSNCCSLATASCPGAAAGILGDSLTLKNFIAYNNSRGSHEQALDNPTAAAIAANPLLGPARLPQSSGFALNGQSFIGSPLFAIANSGLQKSTIAQQQLETNRNHLGRSVSSSNSGGSGNSGSGNDNNAVGTGFEEEKLISPARSISTNLNSNPYNLNNDIYGSQTSTAIMNSNLPTSSSSSSGKNIMMMPKGVGGGFGVSNAFAEGNNLAQQQLQLSFGATANGKSVNNNGSKDIAHRAATTMLPAGTTHAGPILCGQHAGPAYRYTNCTDENSLRPCFHRPQVGDLCRAVDDSQLMTGSTQLAGPAAMAKFVQFQDGQCLRTHRDTRSIQMAYLSSKHQATNGNSDAVVSQRQQRAAVPFRDVGNCQQQQIGNSYLAKSRVTGGQQFGNNLGQFAGANATSSTLQTLNGQQQQQRNLTNGSQHLLANQQTSFGQPASNIDHQQQSSATTTATDQCNDIDLMDCGDGSGGFGFKYDPKLIKSSSIETLCGIGDDEAPTMNTATTIHDDLTNYKSNLELMMSLQPCWLPSNRRPLDVLTPIRPNAIHDHSTNINNQVGNVCADTYAAFNDSDQELDANELGDGSILSTLINLDSGRAERLDEMKKKHDIEEFYTASVAKLAAGLKAQVDLKNKRAGLGLHCPGKSEQQQDSECNQQQQHCSERLPGQNYTTVEVNPIELINEFDTLISNNSDNTHK